jgi:glycosyltransferase involved in cell wall biosynthesis
VTTLHIVMVNHAFRPVPAEAADSPAVVVDQLATALTRRSIRVTTISGPGNGLWRPYESVELRAPAALQQSRGVLAELAFALVAGRVVKRMDPDVIHHHATTPTALHPRGIRAPVVFSYATPVSDAGRVPTMGPLSPVSELLERAACRRADRVVAVSQRTAKLVRDRYKIPSRRVVTIWNGVDTETFTPHGETVRAIDILCVARIAPYKDQATLIRALSIPPLANLGAKLLLVGPEDDRAYASSLRALARALEVGDRVEFRGEVSFSELPALYRSSAVVAAPSRAEGLPLALLEAMSSERSIVATAISQHLEVAEGAGVTFVPVGDARATAAEIGRLLTAVATRQRAGRAARQRVLQDFSWDAIAARFEAVYVELARSRSTAR